MITAHLHTRVSKGGMIEPVYIKALQKYICIENSLLIHFETNFNETSKKYTNMTKTFQK